MPKLVKTSTESTLNPTSQMAFAVALCALAAAGVGSIVNHWMTGWMAVGGMAGVGLFYLAVGLLNLRSRTSFEDATMSNVSQRTARPENLYAEAFTSTRFGQNSATEAATAPSAQKR